MTVPASVDPTRAAFVLMDYQPTVLASVQNADELLARAADAVAVAREAGVRIAYVRVAFAEQDYAAIPSHSKAFSGVAAGRYLGADSPEAAVHPAVAPAHGDILVRKTRFGSFSTTNLANFLSPRRFDTLILAGVSTSGAVLSTLRDASDRDYRAIVLADCCADPKPDVHRVLLEQVFPNQADVIDSSALKSLLS